jgi:hypothetical protein
MIGDTRPLLKTISLQKQANLELCDEIKALKEKVRYLESIGQYRTPKFIPKAKTRNHNDAHRSPDEPVNFMEILLEIYNIFKKTSRYNRTPIPALEMEIVLYGDNIIPSIRTRIHQGRVSMLRTVETNISDMDYNIDIDVHLVSKDYYLKDIKNAHLMLCHLAQLEEIFILNKDTAEIALANNEVPAIKHKYDIEQSWFYMNKIIGAKLAVNDYLEGYKEYLEKTHAEARYLQVNMDLFTRKNH